MVRDDRSFFVRPTSATRGSLISTSTPPTATPGSCSTETPRATTSAPISRDKRYIALVRPRTTNDADIFLHDRQASTTTQITKHTGEVNYSPQDFTPDGNELLITSDSGREFAALSVSRHRHRPADHRLRAELGRPRRRLLQGREVPDCRRQRGLAPRCPAVRCGHAEAGRAVRDAVGSGARYQALA